MDYDLWQALLDGAELGKDVFNDGSTIGLGFWRTKDLKPVATWLDEDGNLVMTIEDQFVDGDKQVELWSWVLARPVTEEAYRHAMETGGEWADTDNAVVDFAKALKAADTADAIKALVEKMTASAASYKDIENDDQSAACQSLRSSLLEAKRKADSIREEEKRPHLEAGRKVDNLWQPVIKDAELAANNARGYIAKWEMIKREAIIAANKRAAEAAAEAAKAAEAAGEPPPEAPEPEVNTPAPQATVKGGAGRAASIRTKMVVTTIDPRTVFEQYRTNPEVIELLKKLAQKDVDKGLTVEGATVVEQVDVR
jgi:hypothetical protein